MKYTPDLGAISYSIEEAEKINKLGLLFADWHQHFSAHGSSLRKHLANDMVFDGFYPNYFSQKKRILFVGRESRGISGSNYLDMLYRPYRENGWIGKQRLNANKFHSRMIYIAYGIMNGMPAWKDIPYASEIGATFGSAGGLSFAFMNISKLSNESADWPLDSEVFTAALKLSTKPRNFIEEQISILTPDIVISMNLGDNIGSLGRMNPLSRLDQAGPYWLVSAGHKSLLVNAWHFSAPSKDSINDFYRPICNAIRQAEGFHQTSGVSEGEERLGDSTES